MIGAVVTWARIFPHVEARIERGLAEARGDREAMETRIRDRESMEARLGGRIERMEARLLAAVRRQVDKDPEA
ncbi:MAG: hypothetical protein OXK77_14065 [Gemmatimonadota bacterium]|nr:hypothetical protein [Gemmatimonadota bacterium]MDE2865277.1 hypothetical protein [Gemmatimonadota bacterium]